MTEPKTGQERPEARIEPGQDVEIDLFRPADAPGVAELFRLVYGEGYPIPTFRRPELLIQENAAARTISSVARTLRGEIVGHNALYQSAPYRRIYESGAGLVHPAYRGGKGIFTGLIAHGQEIGRTKFGVEAVFGESVCNHVFTQKATAGQGWVPHAIEVDLMPASAYVQERSAQGRVTSLLDVRTLKPRPHRVCLPAVYEGALRFLYDGLDDRRELDFGQGPVPPEAATEIDVQVFSFAGVARLTAREAGADFDACVDAHEKGLRGQGTVVIQVWLKLDWPWVGTAVESLRQRGYFLGGILPRWFDVDGLLMQRIFGRPNWEGIRLYSARAEKILEIVKKDWEQTAGC